MCCWMGRMKKHEFTSLVRFGINHGVLFIIPQYYGKSNLTSSFPCPPLINHQNHVLLKNPLGMLTMRNVK